VTIPDADDNLHVMNATTTSEDGFSLSNFKKVDNPKEIKFTLRKDQS